MPGLRRRSRREYTSPRLATLAVGVGLIAYNGHAGLGASAYQHNQTDLEFVAATSVSDGTSNTIMFGERA